MIHYHGTPITPLTALYEMAGRHFCVSFADPRDTSRCHAIGQSVMLDNGAFSEWKQGKPTNWPAYYAWAEEWISYPTTWAVIPDVIDAGEEAQDELILQWPYGQKGAPVWHMDEPIERLLRLVGNWDKVCVGSTSKYAEVMSDPWRRRMDDAFNEIAKRHHFLPWVHMLRGMACSGEHWPFASVDSTDIARSHNRPQNSPRKLADRWDAVQCPGHWTLAEKQMELIG